MNSKKANIYVDFCFSIVGGHFDYQVIPLLMGNWQLHIQNLKYQINELFFLIFDLDLWSMTLTFVKKIAGGVECLHKLWAPCIGPCWCSSQSWLCTGRQYHFWPNGSRGVKTGLPQIVADGISGYILKIIQLPCKNPIIGNIKSLIMSSRTTISCTDIYSFAQCVVFIWFTNKFKNK